MNNAPAMLDRAQRHLAANGGQHIGDLIAWNSSSIDVLRIAAREIFDAENFGHLIPEMDPATALSRAQAEVRRPVGVMVRAFAKPKDDTSAAVGVYVQRSRDGESGDEWVCGARCRVDRTTGVILALAPEGAPGIDLALAHAEAMATHVNHLVTHCETRDVSSAMVATVKALGAVPLRNRGGFYLLPPATCATWLRLKPGLEQLGVEPIRVEMHDAPDNIATAKAAAKGALEADIAELLVDLEKAATDGMRDRAIERRIAECNELKAKAELFRGVLADVTDQINRRLEKAQDHFRAQLETDDSELFSIPIVD